MGSTNGLIIVKKVKPPKFSTQLTTFEHTNVSRFWTVLPRLATKKRINDLFFTLMQIFIRKHKNLYFTVKIPVGFISPDRINWKKNLSCIDIYSLSTIPVEMVFTGMLNPDSKWSMWLMQEKSSGIKADEAFCQLICQTLASSSFPLQGNTDLDWKYNDE